MKSNKQTTQAQARRIAKRLKDFGIDVPHGQALEVLAAVFGAENYHVYLASLEEKAPKVKPWKPADGHMSQAQYLEMANGPASQTHPHGLNSQVCPVCGSDNLQDGDFYWTNGKRHLDITCGNCDAEWTEDFAVTAYELNGYPEEVPGVAPGAEGKVYWYTVALYASEAFIAKETFLARNVGEAQSYMYDKHWDCRLDGGGAFPKYFTERESDEPMSLDQVIDWLERKGIEEEALDDWVHDLAQEETLPELNSEADEDAQEEIISQSEVRASDINNGGFSCQLEYLFGWFDGDWNAFLQELAERLEIAPFSPV